jgi:hypothetical protein
VELEDLFIKAEILLSLIIVELKYLYEMLILEMNITVHHGERYIHFL